jgi:peptide/nickel transport system permease protein
MIPILFGVTLLLFTLFNVFGGDPAQRFAGKYATAAQIQVVRAELGLDRSLPEQYFFFLKQIGTLDFGRSWASKQQIGTIIDDGISATLSVMVPAFVGSVLVSIILAMVAARFRGKLFDRGIVIFCLAFMSVSSLVYVLTFQYFFAYHLGWFPISGWDPSWTGRWSYTILPTFIIFVLSLGSEILIYRTAILDEAYQDYVRTARAKGVKGSVVYLKHILKNAMIPIITIVVIAMPYMLTGSILAEAFFGIPGLGGTMVKALNDSDFPVIKAMTVITTLLYMFFNLLSDLLYAVVDPRIKLS